MNMQNMTPNPECATVDTPIVDALHTMHDGKFLHLPVVDRGIADFRGNLVTKVTILFFSHSLAIWQRDTLLLLLM